MNVFEKIRADQVRAGNWVFGKGRVESVERYGHNVEIRYPASGDCRLIAGVSQHIRGDLPVKVLVE